MATFTTEPNRYLLNLNTFNNVITSASGQNTINTAINSLQTIVNTSNFGISINKLSPYTGSNISVTGNLNLSNSIIQFNGYNGLGSNFINGTPYLSIRTNNNEQLRVTSNGIGIGISTPTTNLDIDGTVYIRGNLAVSTMGVPVTSSIGYVFVDGPVYASAFIVSSDSNLKTDIRPYSSPGLPTPYLFKWKSTHKTDIGFLAQDIEKLIPTGTIRHPNGHLGVDYNKLIVLCISEIQTLKNELSTIKGQI